MSADHENVLDAIDASPLAEHDALEVVEHWLDLQPPNGGHMVASTSGDLTRITLYSAGPPEEYAPVVGGFLAEGGANEAELTMLASAGEGLEAAQVGSWIELSKDGLDAGWYFPVNMTFHKARRFAPDNPVSAALGEWARRCGVQDCAQLRRSVDPDQAAAELTVVIPGDDPSHELALVQQGFKSVGAPWFGPKVDRVIRAMGSLELLVVVAIGAVGLNAAGVLVPEPSEELLDVLADAATRYSIEGTDDFEATLDVVGPAMIGCFQYPWGLGLERYYPLA